METASAILSDIVALLKEDCASRKADR